MLAVLSVLYLGAAAACLRQWGSPDTWSRFDIFAGGYFLAAPVWLAETAYFYRVIGRSKETLEDAAGKAYDPAFLLWTSILPLAELAVFLDYGHWRLAPRLETKVLQAPGLVLWWILPAWAFWADRHLGAHFGREPERRGVIETGPFRWVRHPRYAVLLLSRLAFVLIFASAFGWALLLVWLVVVLRRVRLEEAHLARLYGEAWRRYAEGRPRLLPGLY